MNDQSSDIVRLTSATQGLAAILTPTDAVAVIRLADKARELARTMELGTEAENAATSIRLKAEIRLAEVVAEGQKKGEIASQGGDHRSTKARIAGVDPASLMDIGVSSQRLSEARDIAAVMGPGQVDALIAEANDRGQTLSRAAVLKEVRLAGKAADDRVIEALMSDEDRHREKVKKVESHLGAALIIVKSIEPSLTNEERTRLVGQVAHLARRLKGTYGDDAFAGAPDRPRPHIRTLDPAPCIPPDDEPDPIRPKLIAATRQWFDPINKERAATCLRVAGGSRGLADGRASQTKQAVPEVEPGTADEGGTRDAAPSG